MSRYLGNMRFSVMELSGSLGDLGTFIPLTLAIVLTTGMDIGIILLFAGLFNIATGFLFGLPVPVQPMKAIAAVAIVEGLAVGEIATAGLIMGGFMLLLGSLGWVSKIERLTPLSVVRGIQLGVGIKLAYKGAEFMFDRPWWGVDSIIVAVGLALAVFLVRDYKRFPSALILFGFGLMAALWIAPEQPDMFEVSLPTFALVPISLVDWQTGFWRGALPQLPLTLLNSVIAICVLSGDLFPGRRIGAGKMAISVGVMNLIGCGFGGLPVCHGSGGLAGQYRFGARTGGSVVMLGAVKLLIGLCFGTSAMLVLQSFPLAVLSVLLFWAGVELALPSRDQRGPAKIAPMLATCGGILVFNTAAGFLFGILAALLFYAFDKLASDHQ